MNSFEFIAELEFDGKRVDVFLTEKLSGHSRSYYQKLIDENKVTVNGKVIKSNHKLKTGETVIIEIPEPVSLELPAENIPLDIVYEDEYLIVINKPQGMVVHPAHGNYTGTLVNALLYHCGTLSTVNAESYEKDENDDDEKDGDIGEDNVGKGGFQEINGVLRPGIVHRIDKDTSGILVVAKTNEAHRKLSEQLKAHTMTRVYVALIEGKLKQDIGTVSTEIGRSSNDRKKMAVTRRGMKGGKLAITHYKVITVYDHNTLIEARLETGRTHQIRVHMAYLGHPLVGDSVYGIKKQRVHTEGQLLHAKTLGFIHPATNEYVEFEAPLPDYFQKVLNGLH